MRTRLFYKSIIVTHPQTKPYRTPAIVHTVLPPRVSPSHISAQNLALERVLAVMLLKVSHGPVQKDALRRGKQRAWKLKRSFVCLVRRPGDSRQGLLCLEWPESKGNRWDDLGLASWEANTKDLLHKQRIWWRLICLVEASLKA